jgi:Rod binding domain-containing protein
MNVTSATAANIWESAASNRTVASVPDGLKAGDAVKDAAEQNLREAFQAFVGETLFSQMLKAARKTQNKPAYFHGGRAEEMFQQQLDQVLAEKIADSEGGRYCDAMYELFTMNRS